MIMSIFMFFIIPLIKSYFILFHLWFVSPWYKSFLKNITIIKIPGISIYNLINPNLVSNDVVSCKNIRVLVPLYFGHYKPSKNRCISKFCTRYKFPSLDSGKFLYRIINRLDTIALG